MSQSQRRGPRADMVPEIAAAVGFVSNLLRTRGCVSEQQLQVFSGALREALAGEARWGRDRLGGERGPRREQPARGCCPVIPLGAGHPPVSFTVATVFLPGPGALPWVPLYVLLGRAPICALPWHPAVSSLMPDTY